MGAGDSREADGGYHGLVWEVSRSDCSAAVLKVSWQDIWSRDEAVALREWSGNGVARLLRSDDAGREGMQFQGVR